MINNQAYQHARTLIGQISKQDLDKIMEGKLNLRRMLLEEICCNINSSGHLNLKLGLPSLYLFVSAENGDPTAFDLLTSLGMNLNMARPKAPGGKDANATRDFLLSYLSKILMLKYPELSRGANNATREGQSAIDIVRKALEDAGVACIDYRAEIQNCPVPRSAERAVRRFRLKRKYRELFWSMSD